MTKKDLIKELEELADCSDTQNVDESRGYYMGIMAAISHIKNSGTIIFDDKKVAVRDIGNIIRQ